MVYIHGGGLTGGSGILTLFGDRLVREQDVVFVGVNHCLNVSGYTYLGGISPKLDQSTEKHNLMKFIEAFWNSVS